jgi:hypothetical protein
MKPPTQHLAIVSAFNMGRGNPITLSHQRQERKKAPACQRSLIQNLISHMVSRIFLTMVGTYLQSTADTSSNPRKRTREPDRSPTPGQDSRRKARSRSPRRSRTPAQRSPSLDNRSSLARQATRSPSRANESRSRSQSRLPLGGSERSGRTPLAASTDGDYANDTTDRDLASDEGETFGGYNTTRRDLGKHSKS